MSEREIIKPIIYNADGHAIGMGASGKQGRVQQINSQTDTIMSGIDNNESKKHSSEGNAEKEFIEHEFFTLEGEMEVIATKKTIKIQAGQTVTVNGVGKYLSGQYFVDSVARKITNNGGYKHSLVLQKNGFADGMKEKEKEKNDNTRHYKVVKR